MSIDNVQEIISPLKDSIESILANGEKLSEYQLIQALQKSPYEILRVDAFSSDLAVFQTHFVVYHCLYLLQQELLQENIGYLYISALEIRIDKVRTKVPLEEVDIKLAAYYGDWENYQNTDETEVQALLNSFWERFVNTEKRHMASGMTVEQALEGLSLRELPQDEKALKRHYRKMLHQHHPDKGGSTQSSQKLVVSYDYLRSYLSRVEIN